MNPYSIAWLVLMVLCMVVEAATVTLVSGWFAVGALAAMIVAATGGPLGFQLAVFAVVSGALLAALRPIVRKHFTPKLTRTNIDAIIGSECYVTADIDNLNATGTVKLGTMEWTARSSAGTVIPKGTLVKVDKIEGVKVFVTPVEIPAMV